MAKQKSLGELSIYIDIREIEEERYKGNENRIHFLIDNEVDFNPSSFSPDKVYINFDGRAIHLGREPFIGKTRNYGKKYREIIYQKVINRLRNICNSLKSGKDNI